MSKGRGVTNLFWHRNDLRLSDNPALVEAAQGESRLIPLFVDMRKHDIRPWGGAFSWWLHQNLVALDIEYVRMGGKLIYRSGDPVEVIEGIVKEHDVTSVYASRGYTAQERNDEERLQERLAKLGVVLILREATLLHDPNLFSRSGSGYKVFTPFWKALQANISIESPQKAPSLSADTFVHGVVSQDLNDWGLCPQKPNWAASFEPLWKGGEKAALGRLREFLQQDLAGYRQYRDIPGRSGTSRLSPYLRVGAISPRQIWYEMKALGSGGVDAQKFLAEIAWREFSYHLLYFSPDLASKNFNARFDRFRWRTSQNDLKAWQQGKTGYPLVDAGMKELWATGYMHNRVRMVVASFLIKHLLVDWRKGEEWFWDTLVDADPAANAASWQWVAGSGADAAPYFRIFNPVLQSERFDSQGFYIKKWLPELSSLSAKQVHAPWKVSPLELRSAGVTLGSDYPYPVIDHTIARKRALALYKSL